MKLMKVFSFFLAMVQFNLIVKTYLICEPSRKDFYIEENPYIFKYKWRKSTVCPF